MKASLKAGLFYFLQYPPLRYRHKKRASDGNRRPVLTSETTKRKKVKNIVTK